jgi:ethanolamine utilization protein EutQ (cupin superfamily)
MTENMDHKTGPNVAGVRKPQLASSPAKPFGPARISHWSDAAEFGLLGTYAMDFETTGEAAPWTLAYEESVYVVRGEAWVVELDADGGEVCTERATAGELIAIRRGTTVRYGGETNTRLLLSIAPVNWDIA